MEKTVKSGIAGMWKTFVKGEYYTSKGYEPCFYWGRIEFHRNSWFVNEKEVISEYYVVFLNYNTDENSPSWVRDSYIYSNNSRAHDPAIEFKSLDNAKRYIRKKIKSKERIKWIFEKVYDTE
ncbi:hypothetical protein NV379_02230 [Paenibacillus sp. N1-5-1-14]|uniref:hypothetical protein n=1 Tax=Paenibacillus radicibacter TaxID=2972488 RepID=UPI002159848D|nr:hypothetical protein [Paenibacillus radicibacter]MCR8641464.1 hypothetical protein [Paenibacillus radicibacter]